MLVGDFACGKQCLLPSFWMGTKPHAKEIRYQILWWIQRRSLILFEQMPWWFRPPLSKRFDEISNRINSATPGLEIMEILPSQQKVCEDHVRRPADLSLLWEVSDVGFPVARHRRTFHMPILPYYQKYRVRRVLHCGYWTYIYQRRRECCAFCNWDFIFVKNVHPPAPFLINLSQHVPMISKQNTP